ncbi:MAG: hypothetical protein HZA54_00705 [Planctomycetes bacterium]|nr:hypothetical protein [Planctomycetota bacterium]
MTTKNSGRVVSNLVLFCVAACCLQWLFGLASARADKDKPGPEAKLKELLGPEVRKVVPVKKKLAEEAKKKLETALGQTLEAADLEPYLYDVDGVTSPDTGEPVKVRACLTVAKGPSGPIRLGLAVDPKGEVLAAKVFEHGEKTDLLMEEFCQQFVGDVANETSWRSPQDLEAILAKVKSADAEKDPDAAKAKILLRVRHEMEENGELMGELKEKLEKKDAAGAAQAASGMAKELGEVGEQMAKLTMYYKPDQVKHLVEIAGGAKGAAEQVGEAAKKSDWAAAQRAFKEKLHESCEKCHDWSDPTTGKNFYKSFLMMRAGAGVGNGYWVIGHDRHAPAAARDVAQAIASGFKKALLTLDATK